jgi:mRNA interferase YafQ
MTSKKAASSKRTSLPRVSDYTKKFIKDWAKLTESGRYDMKRLKEAMLLLISNENQPGPEWLDHPLKGEWSDHRECHIGGDFLLIYQIIGSGANEIVSFVRAGTHSELFE